MAKKKKKKVSPAVANARKRLQTAQMVERGLRDKSVAGTNKLTLGDTLGTLGFGHGAMVRRQKAEKAFLNEVNIAKGRIKPKKKPTKKKAKRKKS